MSLDRKVEQADGALTITLSPASFLKGDAKPDDYFLLDSLMVTFLPGEMSRNVRVEARNDHEAEGTENLTLTISAPQPGTNWVLDSPSASMPIYDNDYWDWKKATPATEDLYEDMRINKAPLSLYYMIRAASNDTNAARASVFGWLTRTTNNWFVKPTKENTFLSLDADVEFELNSDGRIKLRRNDGGGVAKVGELTCAIATSVSIDNSGEQERTATVVFNLNVGASLKYTVVTTNDNSGGIEADIPMIGKPKVDINLGKKVEVTEEKDFSINVPQQFARTYTAVVFETDDPPLE